ncbi:hypothetical protein Q3G72_014931 [Acer saccharum]|nr:hypothetical protein Q3G72_014931 [Acer saccharum]
MGIIVHHDMQMDGFALLPFESTCVLKDKDVVCVRKKVGVSAEIDDFDNGLEIVKLLANEEFDKETGGYESEFEEDEHEESLHALDLEDTPVVDKVSKKRKALNSKKLQGSKTKKSKLASAKESLDIEDVENDVHVVKSGNSQRVHKKNHVKDKSSNVQKSSSPEIDETNNCIMRKAKSIFDILITIGMDLCSICKGATRWGEFSEAMILKTLSHQDAWEMSYFGANVLHPRTIIPVMRYDIPIVIRNIFNLSTPETMICRSSVSENGDGQKEDSPVKGTRMAGVPCTAYAIFGAVEDVGANVIMISQASSEHSVCFAVPEKEVKAVAEALPSRFRKALDVFPSVTAIQANINVCAIAQGYSEYNITVVIKREDCIRARRAVHSRFYLSRTTKAMGIIGPGLIGATLLNQLRGQTAILKEEFNIELCVMGITGKAAGYTEPDPRDNLSGTDVARKTRPDSRSAFLLQVIILARESGLKLELADLPVQSLVPEPFKSKKQYFSFLDSIEACASAGEFMEKLPQFDRDLAKERQQAEDAGEVLRYVGEVDAVNKKGIVELQRYKKDHLFA